MKTSATSLLISVLFLGGCATQHEQVVVAYGDLVGEHKEFDLGVARYQVSSVKRGTLPTTLVDVVFPSSLQTAALPTPAILVLSQDNPRADTLYPVGQDFRRGILADTPENRARIAGTSDARLLDNPRRLWLPKNRALDIIREHLRSKEGGGDVERLRVSLRRYQFGWSGAVTFPDANGEIPVGGESYIGVTDAGEILYWHTGL